MKLRMVAVIAFLITTQPASLALAGSSKDGDAVIIPQESAVAPGVESQAFVVDGSYLSQLPDDSAWVPSSYDGVGMPVPVAIAAHNCGVLYMVGNAGHDLSSPLQIAGPSDCAALAPPEIDPDRVDPESLGPADLAAIAFDRARSLASAPQLRIVPGTRGITGLASYFWLASEPATVSATAQVEGVSVTAEAVPVQYDWSFGDGAERTTQDSGRPWTRSRRGSIPHMYETKGNYEVSVAVLYSARWTINGGAWRPLGYFSISSSDDYRVREVRGMLARSRR